jgi:catechol 2,3-dioxygenase-like lactoylglutathione lyase family enzyme
MNQQLAMITLVVKDYDQAIQFYTRKLNFQLIEDTTLSDVKRWVVVSPPGSVCKILLAKAANETQSKSIGNQTGGRVFLFLHTDDIVRDLENLQRNEVKIVRGPSQEIYGTVAVFEDLYGNLWDLIQPVKK